MMKLQQALREVRAQRAQVHVQRYRAHCALSVLEQQYRITPALPLGIAAAGGAWLGYSRRRMPRGVVSTLWRWGMLMVRGLL